MNDPENFITRWSRRKREAVDEKTQPENTNTKHAAKSAPGDDPSLKSPESGAATPPMTEFDVASLPPIESIKAGTDISAFMRSGVPSALRHAALRRAWSADPSIRDFVGLNENFWDAVGPGEIPGFGDLDPNLDVKRMVSKLFGENTSEKPKADSSNASAAPSVASERKVEASQVAEAHLNTGSADLSQETKIAAAQNEPSQDRPEQKPVRRHGGALPE